MRLRFKKANVDFLNSSVYLVKSYPFPIENPLLELGMGKGDMLTTLAKAHPERNFVGIERNATIAGIAAKKANELKLANFHIICDDIENLATFFVGKVSEIYLTFSDPWPKNKHEKRRLTHTRFLEIYKKILVPQGILKLKTDDAKFFDYSLNSLNLNGWEIQNWTADLHNSKFNVNNVFTEYERRFASQKKIAYLEAKFN